MPKRSATGEPDDQDTAKKTAGGTKAAKQVEGSGQTRKRESGGEVPPSEPQPKRPRNQKPDEQASSSESAVLSIGDFKAELETRRRTRSHKSIARRAAGQKFRLGSTVNQAYSGCFFSCIYNQIDTLGIKSDFPFVADVNDILDLCIQWLDEHRADFYSPPTYTDEFAQNSRNKTPRNSKRSKTVEKMMTPTFFDDLRSDCPAVNSLALFGCCNALKARIAVLLPATVNRRKWEVWEPLECTDETHTLYVAKVHQSVYESLLDNEEDMEAALSSSEDEAGDDNIVPTAPISALSLKATGNWVQCSNVQCQKVRYVFEEISDKKTWTCDRNVNASSENQCSDADIWNQINSFWSKGNNKNTIFRLLGRKPVQMSELFIAVQAVAGITPDLGSAGSFTALNQHRKATELALKLGGEGLQKSSAASQLKAIYDQVFVALRSSGAGGGNLEHLLLQQEQVQQTITAHTPRILGWLGLAPGGRQLVRAPASSRQLRAAELPVVYQKSAQTQLSTENLHHMMRNFAKAASMFPADACLSPMLDLLGEVQEVLRRGGDLHALMLHGTTGVGKSQISDLLLMISEGIDSEYGAGAPSDPAASESSRYINELVQAELQLEADACSARGGSGGWTDRVLVVDSAELEKFVSKEMLNQEWGSKHSLSSWCLAAPDRPADLSKVISYILPVGDVDKMHNSTTACAVSIVYAETFQVVLEYRSEAEVLGQWRKWSKLKAQLDDDDADLSSSQRKQLEREVEAIVEEVKRALAALSEIGGRVAEADEDDAEEFLQDMDLERIPELRTVLGSRFGLIGAGDSAIKDRIFARRVLHYAQGMPDPTHEFEVRDALSDSAHVGSSDVPPFLRFGNNSECLLFGKRTGFALKQLTVMGPCAIAPQRGSGQKGWFDPCGLGDADILKEKVFSKSASQADAVLVVMKDTLKRAGQTFQELKTTKAMVDLVKAEMTEATGAAPRMFLATNYELNWNQNAKKLLTIDELSSAKVLKSKSDHTADNLKYLSKIADKIAKDSCEECGTSKDIAAKVAATVSNGTVVPVACPTVFLFASLVLNTNYEKLSFKERLDKLEQTDCYPMLGFIERVLQGSKHEMVVDLKTSAQRHLADLKAAEERLHQHGQGQPQTPDAKRLASRGSANRTGKKEYMRTLDVKLKGKSHFKAMNETLRRKWDEFVDEYGERSVKEWPGKNFNHNSQWHEGARLFLKDCEESDFNPFDPECSSDAQLQGDLRSVDALMSEVWRSGCNVLADRLGKMLIQSSFAVELCDGFESLAKECAHEIATEVGSSLKDEQLAKLDQAVKRHVEGKLKALSTELKDFVRSSDVAYRGAVSSLRAEVFAGASAALRRELLLGKNKKMGAAMQNFVAAVRSHVVAKLKAAFKHTAAIDAGEQDRVRRQRSKGPSTGSSYREVISTGEQFSIGDKFLGMFGLNTKWTKKGNTADVSRWICNKVLDEVNPWAVASRANDRRQEIAKAVDTVKSLIEGLEDTLNGWQQTATDVASMGRQLTGRFMALRQAEDLANRSGAGLSILAQSQHCARVDTTPKNHAELHGGYIFFDFNKHFHDAVACKWRPQNLQKLQQLAGQQELKLTTWKREEADKDALFHVYGQLLGVAGEAVVTQMRAAVAQMALRDKASDSAESVARIAAIAAVHVSLEEYVSGMQRTDEQRKAADVVALTYLVDYFERPLNLYTCWSTHPLRIMPLSLRCQEKDYREADAFVYLGWQTEFRRTATSASEGESTSASDNEDDADEPQTIIHFVRCIAKNDALVPPGVREDAQQHILSPKGAAGWSLDDGEHGEDNVDAEQQMQEGWGLLEYRLTQKTNYKLHEVHSEHGVYGAVAHQIRVRFGSEYPQKSECTHLDVRKDVAGWLRENSSFRHKGGAELSSFLTAEDGNLDQFRDAVQRGKEGRSGHLIALIAAANVYRKSIRIWFTNRTKWWLEIHPANMGPEEKQLYFELGHCSKQQSFMSVHERFDSVIGLLPCLPAANKMLFQEFVASSVPTAADAASELTQADPTPETEDDSDGDGGRGECAATTLDPVLRLRTPNEYRYATFNPMRWTEVTDGQPCYVWKNDRSFRLSPDNFTELASRFSGFTERWSFLRGKQEKDYSRFNRPGCTRFFSCDDAIAHLLGCVAVFDGVGEGYQNSGSFARLLAKHVADRSFEPVPLQETTEVGYNRSMRLLRLAHGGASREYRKERSQASAEAQECEISPTTTAVILTLVCHAGRTFLHWLVHGDSQWALLRKKSGKYSVKHFSAPTIRRKVQRKYQTRGNTEQTVTLDEPYQIGLSSASFEDDKPRDRKKMMDCIEVKEGDLIVAGTDGFFDNFGDDRPQKLQKLETLCNLADKDVGKSSSKGHLTEAFGTRLKAACLDYYRKNDDVTLFVGKISLSLRPGEERRTGKGIVDPWFRSDQPGAKGMEELFFLSDGLL